jgi:DNA-binding NarL/FixJ family response regulator
MPGTDGIEATRRIRQTEPSPAVIILTTFDHDEYVLDAMRAGAAGFLLKDGDVDDLARAIRVAAQGDAIIAPSVLGSLIANLAIPPHHHREAVDAVATLTEREREVLGQVAAGRRNDEICQALQISAATTKTHISHVFAKLGVRDRAQAVVMAYESGLAKPGGAR